MDTKKRVEVTDPVISVIIASYNRAGSVERSINSLLNQTFSNLEIIVVDDGSTDNTQEVLKKYEGRIKVLRHEVNRGVCAAKNSGLDQIKGKWFTFLDDDDELVPNAFEELLKIPDEIDSTISAITCNCIDSTTNEFSGRGLIQSGYITLEDIVTRCSGEFWGITKTSLLANMRFNNDIPGGENVLWYRIDEIANRYYTHQALRIYHTDGEDRVTLKYRSPKTKIKYYKGLAYEDFYWEVLYRYNLPKFKKECCRGKYFLTLAGHKGINPYRKRIKSAKLILSPPDSFVYWSSELLGYKGLKLLHAFFNKVKNATSL